MQNENELNPLSQDAVQPGDQVTPNAQSPSVVSKREKVIQPLDPNLTAQITPPQPVVSSDNSNTSPTNVSYDVANIYPTASADATPVNDTISPYPTIHLTGSQMAQEKKPLHWGIYIIAAWNLVGFMLSFFSTSQTNAIYTIEMFLDLLVGIGLLFRLELARKLMIWLGGILLIFSAISLILFAGLQQRIAQSKANYDNALSHINQQQLTPEQQQQLATIRSTISSQQKQAGKAIGLTYFKEGASFVEGLVVLIYLTRPKIKDVFVELPK